MKTRNVVTHCCTQLLWSSWFEAKPLNWCLEIFVKFWCSLNMSFNVTICSVFLWKVKLYPEESCLSYWWCHCQSFMLIFPASACLLHGVRSGLPSLQHSLWDLCLGQCCGRPSDVSLISHTMFSCLQYRQDRSFLPIMYTICCLQQGWERASFHWCRV